MYNITQPESNQTYNEYIKHILLIRPNKKDEKNYQEKHHIIPKTLNGSDDEDNLIWLYAEEHYYAHKLLALENPTNQGLQLAWWNMCQCTQNKKRVYNISAEDYALARKLASKASSELLTGKKLSESHKESLKGHGRAVVNITTNENFISGYEAAQKYGLSYPHIKECCDGKRSSCGKDENQIPYIWRYAGEEDKDFGFNIHYAQKKVMCIETKQVYESIREANRKTGVHRRTIYTDCNKTSSRQNKKRLHFVYYED